MIHKLLSRPVLSKLLQNNIRLMATGKELPATDLVLAEEIGDKGLLTLNRPKALNSCNFEMVNKVGIALDNWKNTKSIIIIKGVGGKAFCAGGDVKTIVEADTPEVGKKFFGTEYVMNYDIGTLTIPYVALIDGITMGGGVGLSVHGRYRIATEKTLFAMPETAIGLFPDVGGSYFLPRLQGRLGYYLGLTGFRLKGQDVFHAGVATHYCESAKIPEIEKALLELKNTKDVDNVINDFCPKPKSEFVLAKHLDQINKTFNAPTVEEILSNLEKDGSEWAQKTIKTLRTVSPTSLKVTLRLLDLGSNFSLGECLQMEYRLAVRCVEDSDFHEGVRALLITKDNNPKWNPPRIEDVTEERVKSFFQPLPNNEDLKM
ncbi:3-hydroxyisobutyryl-CoA hydrolase, mitochondrial-like isoform X2 [Sitodiplosis mosellana]|uniref:3-hydroxyisobutyryl-CoA hydrolase, mitochondrial-like isoform X2 n=1 Tax=Sitodiplosis mosellana TaxID=263140 RepID=UPI00244493A4|nr:3-hydroxyisobutyryl-CoA hydrolase, mitochondrial-like isoform X2 [Sitodiplosis mosellana]